MRKCGAKAQKKSLRRWLGGGARQKGLRKPAVLSGLNRIGFAYGIMVQGIIYCILQKQYNRKRAEARRDRTEC